MSADLFGGRVLSEVKEETLNELLRSLRDSRKRDQLGIPEFDRLLTIFIHTRRVRRTEQNALPASLGAPQNDLQHLDLTSRRPLRAPVIELAGVTPCSGKTQLLYYITVVSLMPKTYKKIPLDGREGAIVWFDTDGRLSTQRIYTILHSEITRRSRSSPSLSVREIEQISIISLANLHIFRSQSSLSLISTIRSLPTYLLNPAHHHSSARPLQAIIISNLNAFLAQDRFDSNTEISNRPAMHHQPYIPNSNFFMSRHVDLVHAFREIQKIFDCVIIAGSWSFTPVQYTANGPILRSYLPSVWNSFCSLRLVIERAQIQKFGPTMSAEEALQEAGRRQEAVEEGRFLCWVNLLGSEDWDDGVHVSLGQLDRNGRFSFRATSSGAMINDENYIDG